MKGTIFVHFVASKESVLWLVRLDIVEIDIPEYAKEITCCKYDNDQSYDPIHVHNEYLFEYGVCPFLIAPRFDAPQQLLFKYFRHHFFELANIQQFSQSWYSEQLDEPQ